MIDITQIHTFRDLFRVARFNDEPFTNTEVCDLIDKCIDLKDAQFRDILDEYDRAHKESTDQLFRTWRLTLDAAANK